MDVRKHLGRGETATDEQHAAQTQVGQAPGRQPHHGHEECEEQQGEADVALRGHDHERQASGHHDGAELA